MNGTFSVINGQNDLSVSRNDQLGFARVAFAGIVGFLFLGRWMGGSIASTIKTFCSPSWSSNSFLLGNLKSPLFIKTRSVRVTTLCAVASATPKSKPTCAKVCNGDRNVASAQLYLRYSSDFCDHALVHMPIIFGYNGTHLVESSPVNTELTAKISFK